MSDEISKRTLVAVKSSAANKIDADFDADEMLESSFAEIRAIRKKNSPKLETRRLVKATGDSEHLRKIFENGHQSKVQEKAKS